MHGNPRFPKMIFLAVVYELLARKEIELIDLMSNKSGLIDLKKPEDEPREYPHFWVVTL